MSEFHQRLKSKITPCDTKPKENEIDRIKRIYNSFIRDNDLYNEKTNSLLRTDVNLAFDEIKESIRRIINTYYTPEDIEHLKVLEVGTAWGQKLRMFIEFGFAPNNLFGVDLIPHFTEVARRLSPKEMNYLLADSQYLPFPNATFDIVFQCITFSSILDKTVRRNIGMEMTRVLTPKGLIIWIDSGDSNDKSKYCGEVFYQGIDFPEIRKEIFPGADIIRFPKIILKKDIFRKCLTSTEPGINQNIFYT